MGSSDLDSERAESTLYDYAIARLEAENALLKETVSSLKEETDRLRRSPLMLCEVVSLNKRGAVIRLPNGNQFLVGVSSGCKGVAPGDFVFVEQKNLVVMEKAECPKQFASEKLVVLEKPGTSWGMVGGLDEQKRQVQEVVELPLTQPELFSKVGITPPRGVLLYGLPGTGKTLVAKAVAASTKANFIEVAAPELVQKFIGEGAKLVREVFQIAREKAPSIIFIDEIDALAGARTDTGMSGEREVQRTFMQLLAEIDGFRTLDGVVVIGSTNRKDILDPALLRSGRLEKQIYFPVPDAKGRAEIFRVHLKPMRLGDIELGKIVAVTQGFTGSDIKEACTEAGYAAIRDGRSSARTGDFLKAVEKMKSKNENIFGSRDYISMFG